MNVVITYPPEEQNVDNTSFQKGDVVRIDDPEFDIERYMITEVLGKENVAMYAVIGMQTGAKFSYFLADELKKA